MPDGTSATPAPSPAAALRDFSDRLPPVLVKELRQGLRGKMFVIPFLVLQGLLMLSSGQGTLPQTLFFWHCLAVMLVILLPSRNLGALGEERQANTLDTLILTRLTPWRIVWGKWCATAAQSALTTVAAIPYLLVRYLNSGTNFVHEGLLLLVLLLVSGAMAGIFTVFSVVKSPLARNGLAAVVTVVVYGWLCLSLISMFSTGVMPEWRALAGIAVIAVWAALFSLWQAACSIAPAAANLTTPRRLTSLAAVALLGLLLLSHPAPSLFHGLLGVLAAISMVEMGERPHFHPGMAASFARRGVAGKWAAVFFHPGWPSGVVFCLTLWGLMAFLALDSDFWPVASLCFFPVTARCLMPRQTGVGPIQMLLFAALSQMFSHLLMPILPGDARFIALWLPSLQQDARAGVDACRQFALIWAGIALLLAAKPLVRLLLISPETAPADPSPEKYP